MLSTKAFSTLLTKEWFQIFTEWITYPIIAVRTISCITVYKSRTHGMQILVGTGVGQIKYLNRALMRFDSKVTCRPLAAVNAR